MQNKKKDAYHNWRVVTDSEEGWQNLSDIEDNDDDGAVTLEPHIGGTQLPDSGSTLTESVQCGTNSISTKFNKK